MNVGKGKVLIPCTSCYTHNSSKRASNTIGVNFVEIINMDGPKLFMICKTCKSIQFFPVEVKEEDIGKIYHCNRNFFKCYEARNHYVLRCIRCTEVIKISKPKEVEPIEFK